MFLSGVLFVLFLAGCWLYCLTDAALTPTSAFPGLRKQVWIAIISVTFILGAVAWVIARYRSGSTRAVDLFLASEALARHPASRSRLADPSFRALPIGPDDDPEFLLSLDRFISGPSDSGELSCQHLCQARLLASSPSPPCWPDAGLSRVAWRRGARRPPRVRRVRRAAAPPPGMTRSWPALRTSLSCRSTRPGPLARHRPRAPRLSPRIWAQPRRNRRGRHHRHRRQAQAQALVRPPAFIPST